ncbi:MAG: hypothetical protein QGG36_15415 [Pirellulaceae bacterium]|nr:hypothetical protein [Pirellulaceae bacterium]MDP7017193.1 hypothetical protein [Pirellulaceae bacterium]
MRAATTTTILLAILAPLAIADATVAQTSNRRVRRLPPPNRFEGVDVRPPAMGQLTADIRPRPESDGTTTMPPRASAEYFKRFGVESAAIEIVDRRVLPPRYDEWSAFPHRPLYFEEVNLERHGVHYGRWQPAISGAHFALHTVSLPYQMSRRRPNYAYFHNRVGVGRDDVLEAVGAPWDSRAGLVEAATVVGLILLLP